MWSTGLCYIDDFFLLWRR